jgi:hypothetical protein
MINQDVIDLFQRVPANAKVIVLNRDGSIPTAMVLPPPSVPRRVAPVVPPVLPNNGLPAFVPMALPPVPPSLAG